MSLFFVRIPINDENLLKNLPYPSVVLMDDILVLILTRMATSISSEAQKIMGWTNGQSTNFH